MIITASDSVRHDLRDRSLTIARASPVVFTSKNNKQIILNYSM